MYMKADLTAPIVAVQAVQAVKGVRVAVQGVQGAEAINNGEFLIRREV